jgi:hypothetical protein
VLALAGIAVVLSDLAAQGMDPRTAAGLAASVMQAPTLLAEMPGSGDRSAIWWMEREAVRSFVTDQDQPDGWGKPACGGGAPAGVRMYG